VVSYDQMTSQVATVSVLPQQQTMTSDGSIDEVSSGRAVVLGCIACTEFKDVVCSYQCSMVCVFVCYCARMAEPIEMPFGGVECGLGWTQGTMWRSSPTPPPSERALRRLGNVQREPKLF